MQRVSHVSFVCAIALLGGCAESQSPEQQVRAVIEEMELAAEQRDVGGLLAHLASGYRDAHGQDSREAARYVRGYFIAHQSIHLLTRVDAIEFPSADEARATVKVGMLGNAANEAASLDLAADLYEFDIGLVRESGDWKVEYARWKRL